MVRSLSERTAGQTFEWKIGDILNNGSLESIILNFCGCQWQLRLEKTVNTKYVGPHGILIILNKISSSERCSILSVESFIEDCNKKAWKYRKIDFNSSTQSSKEVWEGRFRKLSDVKRMQIDGVITFVFGFKLVEGQQAIMKGDKQDESIERLTEDFRRLLQDDTYSDVLLKCGDVTISAHRNILSARSEVFGAMLRSDMVENRSGLIEISDMDPTILKEMVQFIYCGKLKELSMDTASLLYVAADKYAIDTLKIQCSAFISRHLTEGNACNILVLADALCDRELKECVTSFILDKELMLKDMWRKFSDDYTKLANEILIRAYKVARNIK